MPKMKKPPRAKLRNLQLGELSLVDNPANQHAHVTLIKRGASKPQVSKNNSNDVVDAIVKYYISGGNEQGATSFREEMTRMTVGTNRSKLMEVIGPVIWALQGSLDSIAGDMNLSSDEKQAMMRTSTEQFLTAVAEKWPEAEENINKAYAEGEFAMPTPTKTELEKIREELEGQVAELTAKVEKLSEENPDAAKAAKADELQSQLDELNKKLEETVEAQKKAEAERDEAQALAKLSDAERAHAESLEGEARKEFLDMEPKERKKVLKSLEDDDEVLKVGDREIRKSVVGEDQFAVMKAQQERIDKQEADLAKQREEAEMLKFEKRAEDELGSFDGEISDKAKALKAIAGIEDEDVRKTIEKMIDVGHKAVKAAFDTVGHRGGGQSGGNGDADTAKAAFAKKVAEVAAERKLSKSDATIAVRKENPDLFKEMQGEEASTQ